MQFTFESILAGVSLIGSLFVTGMSYGILKGRVTSVERSHKAMKDRQNKLEEAFGEVYETFVPKGHFDDVVKPLQNTISDMQKDIKEILKLLMLRATRG